MVEVLFALWGQICESEHRRADTMQYGNLWMCKRGCYIPLVACRAVPKNLPSTNCTSPLRDRSSWGDGCCSGNKQNARKWRCFPYFQNREKQDNLQPCPDPSSSMELCEGEELTSLQTVVTSTQMWRKPLSKTPYKNVKGRNS